MLISSKTIVISAVNLTEAGALTILKECLHYAANNLSNDYNIVALVNNKRVVFEKDIKYYEFPKAKKSWLNRLFYEYVYFYGFSKKLKPYLWFSLQDITPNVQSEITAVYCQNPTPFYSLPFMIVLSNLRLTLFNLFYKYLYRLNLRKNNFVILQQDWLRRKFKEMYGMDHIIVAYPDIKFISMRNSCQPDGVFRFFYPAFPRICKNFDVVCKAASILYKDGISNFEVCLTIDGKENSYSKHIYRKYKDISNIKFLGLQSREKVFEIYHKTDCLVFPSILETWGMPITEFKQFSKPILLADMEYARETIGGYDKAKFFNPKDALQLSGFMKDVIKNKLNFDIVEQKKVAAPFASNWNELFDILLAQG